MSRGSVTPTSLLLGAAFVAVAITFIRSNDISLIGSSDEDMECPHEDPRLCFVPDEEARRSGIMDEPEVVLAAEDVCVNVGYLCADVEKEGVTEIYRWPDDTQTLTVRVPLPDFESRAKAAELQRAAVRGLQAWQGHPFGLVIQTGSGGGRAADIEIAWSRTLGGRQIGETNLKLGWAGGKPHLEVTGLRLTTRSPRNPSTHLTERQISLVAAHEMGHALGLPHSDASTDVMYPTNTANRLSTRDYRTMEAFYELPNGAEIRHNP